MFNRLRRKKVQSGDEPTVSHKKRFFFRKKKEIAPHSDHLMEDLSSEGEQSYVADSNQKRKHLFSKRLKKSIKNTIPNEPTEIKTEKLSSKAKGDWFENYCETFLKDHLNDSKWRIYPQHQRKYMDGKRRRLDFHIAERRRGGKGFVIECKHYPDSQLRLNIIDQVLDYKKRSRASGAILMLSNESINKKNKKDNEFLEKAEKAGIKVFIVHLHQKNNHIRNFFLKKQNFEKLLN